MRLDFHHVRILDALRQEGSFRRAAARLGMSQPALSRQVARVEKQLGVKLVERGPSGATLTEAGRIVVRHTTSINAAMDRMARDLRALDEERTEHLTLAASLKPAVTVPHLLSQGYRVRVERVRDPVAVSMVEAGQADVAFIVDDPDRPYTPPRGVRAATVMETPLWVALPREHRLRDRERIALRDLSGEQWLVPTPGNLRAIVRTACADSGFTPDVRLSGEVDLLLGTVDLGVGITLASPLCGRFFGNRLVMRQLAEPLVERKLCVWRSDRVSSAMVHDLIEKQQQAHLTLSWTEPAYEHWLETHPYALPSVA